MANMPTSPSSKSPERKKARPISKPRKTYFFQPTNTLAYNPQPPAPTEPRLDSRAARSVSPSKGSSYSHANFPAQRPKSGGAEIADARTRTDACSSREDAPKSSGTPAEIAHKIHPIPIFDRSSDQHSSDDSSFDGVRWRPANSPANRNTRPILSSPLRNADASRAQPQNDIKNAAPLVNEITDSIISKYGSVGSQPTLSQTPLCVRTTSDGVRRSLDISPTLVRSKSFDPRCLPRNKLSALENGSRLNSWIDKFDDGMEGPAVPSETRVDAVPEKNEAPYDDDELLSSDDDSFLANLDYKGLTQISQMPPSAPSAENRPRHETPVKPLVSFTQNSTVSTPKSPDDLGVDDSDPFSDDLDIAALDNALTQPSTASSSFVAPSKPESVSVSLAIEKSEIRSSSPWQDTRSVGAKLSYTRPDFTRYEIQSVLQTTYQMQNFKKRQLILTVTDHSGTASKLLVRGEAAELDMKALDIVHVIHTSPETPRLVSDTHNLLIWNPDVLISSTVVADQLDCPRKTVLNKRLSFPGSYSLPLLTGTIVHEIFQICFITEKCTIDYMKSLLEIEIQRRLLDIYTLGDVVDDLRAKIWPHLPYIQKWFQNFFKKPPSEIPTNKRHQKIGFSVGETLDIEERVWSPMFGIKGIADVTLKANLKSDNSIGQFLLPMEIKTGQPYISHQAQAALYSLLYKDRYNVDITSFLLVYTSNEGSTTKHDISVSELKSLVNLRNRISVFLRPGNQELPDLMRQQKCDRCFVQESCMTFNYLTEDGTAEGSALKEGVYEDLTSHLIGKQKYKDFLAYWDLLLSKEEEFVSRFDKELWVMTATEREESSGKSIGSLVISESDDSKNSGDFIYTFQRQGAQGKAFNASQISKNDRVLISDEAGHFALASGYVRHIGPHTITIASKRQIISTESKTDRFHRAGVLRASQKVLPASSDSVVFRLDKDEFSYGMGVARFNILNLFTSEGDHKRRSLIVDLRQPTFSSTSHFMVDKSGGHFNSCQERAFDKVSKTNDYSLILGMPGTGKTTVIAHLIKMLVAAKKTVLLTSYTNSAVDNILIKVKEYGIDFLRIGSPSRIHPEIREYAPGSESKKVESYSDFQQVYSNSFVVAATCLSIQDAAFSIREHFDYCIIDEASQVSMPISLGPIALCDKFIMVGDHFQLPPLVSHPDAKIKAGLSQSLFQLLASAHPDSVVELKHQYRMCEEIMLISNSLVYKNRLICGNERVAGQVLEIPERGKIKEHFSGNQSMDSQWLEPVFEEKNKVVFLDHDLIPGYEKSVGDNITNPTEVELVRQTVEALCSSGVNPAKIGIMTLYRSQLKLLTDTFRHIPALEILTADRFQGRDKDCIIISMVRSNKERRSGDLLRDWRRINVAVTRARAKLIVFGSVSTLSNAESVCDFVALAKRQGWVQELDETTLGSYNFEKPPHGTPRKTNMSPTKISLSTVARHPLVRNILADMTT